MLNFFRQHKYKIGLGLGLLALLVWSNQSNLRSGWQQLRGQTESNETEVFHEHANLHIYIEDQLYDLSAERFQSDPYQYRDQHIHLHDQVGHVIHLHKPGVSLNQFLTTLDISLDQNCISLPDENDQSQVYCDSDDNVLHLYVNGKYVLPETEYQIQDLDRILVYYGADDPDIIAPLIDAVPDDACIYSRTCPERGDPPTEQCIADANTPCVLPEH